MTKMKYLALLTILPIFTAIIVVNNIGTSEAIPAEGSPGTAAPKSYGAATAGIVCGDRLCSDVTPTALPPTILNVVTEDMPGYMPSLEFVDMYVFDRLARDTYAVMFSVTAGNTDLENIIIQCKSDVFAHEIVIDSLKAFESATGMSRVKALDPTTITGEIVAFQLVS